MYNVNLTAKGNAIVNLVYKLQGAEIMNLDYIIKYPKNIRKKAINKDSLTFQYWDNIEEIEKHVKNMNINLGVVYSSAVDKLALRNGYTGDQFEAQQSKGFKPCNPYHKCLQQNLEETKVYLCYPPKCTSNTEIVYMLHGKDITESTKGFCAVSKAPSTQKEIGLNDQTFVQWNRIFVDNITRFSVLGVTIE